MEAGARKKEAAPGDASSASWLQPHVGDLGRFVRLLMGNSSSAEDVMQETLIRALTSLGRYDVGRPLRPWLRGIALKVAHTFWRTAKRGRRLETALSDAAGWAVLPSTPEDDAMVCERAALLYRAMEDLSPKLREAVLLYDCEGLPPEEVARLTHATVGAVYTRICRAREFLHRRLVRDGELSRQEDE